LIWLIHMSLYLIALQSRLYHLLIALFWVPTKRGYEFMSLSVLELFSLWPLSESLFDKVIEALFNSVFYNNSGKATEIYFLSKKKFLTFGEKMTQKSSFLGKQAKVTVSLRIGLRGKISQQRKQQIKLLFAPKESTRACSSILHSVLPPLVEPSNSILSSFEAKHSCFRASWS